MHIKKRLVRKSQSLIMLVGFIAISLLTVTITQIQPARALRMEYFPLAPSSFLIYGRFG